jgi:hypothetical protein
VGRRKETVVKILLIDSVEGTSEVVAHEMQNAGHTVVACYDRGAVRCVGAERVGCPLDADDVDCAVLVEEPTTAEVAPRLPLREAGTLCASRHRVPVLRLADGAVQAEELERRCEREHGVRDHALADLVQTEVDRIPMVACFGPGAVMVHVHRTSGRMSVVLDIASVVSDEAVRSAVTWATRAARDADAYCRSIDISVRRAS